MKSWPTLDTKLHALHELVKDNKAQQDAVNYEHLKPAYKAILAFIKRKRLIVYGGYGLNELMPTDHKIYSPHALPDLDAFSLDSWKDARELVDELKARGFQYVKATEAIHLGTVNVTVEMHKLVDLTNIAPSYHAFLMQRIHEAPRRYIRKGIHLAAKEHCFWALSKELATPTTSLFRWEKVYRRYLAFFDHYRFAKVDQRYRSLDFPRYMRQQLPPDITPVLLALRQFATTHRQPVVGNYAVGLHMGLNQSDTDALQCCYLPWIPAMDFLSNDIPHTLKLIKRALRPAIPSRTYRLEWRFYPLNQESLDNIMPARGRLSLVNKHTQEDIPLCRLIDASTQCFSVVPVGDFLVGSVDTCLMLLYAYYCTHLYFGKDGTLAKHVLTLIALLESFIERELADPRKRLSTQCYGKTKTYLDVKKERWNKAAKEYRG